MVGAAYTLHQSLVTVGLGLMTIVASLALRHITILDRVIRDKYREEHLQTLRIMRMTTRLPGSGFGYDIPI